MECSAELQRDMAHLRFVREQIKRIETTRQEQLKQTPQKGSNAKVLQLARIHGLGLDAADMLAGEAFSRDIRDQRAVARYAGLTGSPDESGSPTPRKRARQSRQCAGPARHDPVRVALSDPPKGQRAGAVVLGGCRQR